MIFFKTDLTLIYCDSRRRDSTVAILIAEMLKRRGQISFISSRRNFSKILRLSTPKNIIVIGQINIVFDLIYDGDNLKNRFRKTNIYFYPSEGYATDNEYKAMYPDRYDYKDVKKIFFWGSESLQWVQNHVEIDSNVLENVGYPRLKMAKVYYQLKQKTKHQKIGVVGRFVLLNDLYGVLPMEFIVTEFGGSKDYKGAMLKRLSVEGEMFRTILRAVDYVMAHTDYTVSFRPHPNENPASYSKLLDRYGGRFEISEEVDVADWISGCSKIMGLASSSYIDASLMGVPIICLDRMADVIEDTMIYEPALRLIYETAHLPSDFDELVWLLTSDISIRKSPVFDELIKSNFIGNYDDPIRHVAESIQHVPRKFTTLAIKFAIEFADNFLMMKHRITKNRALEFEYSNAFHGSNMLFVEKYLNCE